MQTACAFLLLTAILAQAEPSAQPSTVAASGPYAIARLDLPSGLSGKPEKLILALRGGKLASFWFVARQSGDQRLHLDDSTVALTRDSLAGKIAMRTGVGAGFQGAVTSAAMTLDLKLDAGRFSGSYGLEMNGTAYTSGKGTAGGVLETTPPAVDAVSPAGAWPSFWGPTLNMAAQDPPPLLDDFAAARPVWRSETYVPTGYGNAPDSRYFTRAIRSGNGGGGSSPVVADGTVYMYFYVPSPASPPALKGNPYWERTYKSDEEFKAAMAKAGANARETRWVLNHFRPLADDVVVAMDAATGATRWTAVLPLRSPNLQTHKHRGVSGVPLVSGNALFVPNLASRLYALDRATGKLLWETPTGPMKDTAGKPSGPHNPSPLLMGGHVVWSRGGSVYGLHPASGQENWKAPGGYYIPWSSGGKQRLIAFVADGIVCIDPADGKVLWKQEAVILAGAPLSAVVAGDVLLAAARAAKGAQPCYTGWQLSQTGARQVWKDEPFPPDENIPVTVAGGKAYLLGAQYIRVLDAATGRKCGERKFAPGEGGPGSNAWLGVAGRRLLFIPEGQHGRPHYMLLDSDLKTVGSIWAPTHTETTAYNSQPVICPVVDGRVFIRGGDGIYCYDLRRTVSARRRRG